jgi:hypothetical protein
LIVEGKYDKKFIAKCISLVNDKYSLQIVQSEGSPDIPNKIEAIETTIDSVLNKDSWYSKYIRDNKRLKILVDKDVPKTKTDSWIEKYKIDKDKMLRTDDYNAVCTEYFYPESLIKECVKDTKLKTGEMLADKPKDEIVKIILEDEDLKKEYKTQLENRVSKSRLNLYICSNLTKTFIDLPENSNLKKLIDIIISDQAQLKLI